jgi:hypothetical protein
MALLICGFINLRSTRGIPKGVTHHSGLERWESHGENN